MKINKLTANFPNNLNKTNWVGDLTIEKIKKYDSSLMLLQLSVYWENIAVAINEANAIRENSILYANSNVIPDKIIILGIGGSAISGEIYRSYMKYALKDKCPIIEICRGTEIPYNVTENTYVYVCSYSGNTDETLSALSKIEAFTKNIVGITSGGKLADICEEKKYSTLLVPDGWMPRCAIYYSIAHIIVSSVRNFNIGWQSYSAIINSAERLRNNADNGNADYSLIDNDNIAIAIARILHNKIPLIYSAQARLEAVNLRWRSQIQENANQLCFGSFFPELNHNEINSWSFPSNLIDDFVVVVLKDEEDGAEINNRIDYSTNFLKEKGVNVIEIPHPKGDLLERIVRQIYLCDWVSFYMAIFNEVDPTPIPLIIELKNRK